ncbi:MAG: thioredoxin-disulfide reductase [Treponema sp.]|nr:thioredoxin-disulfide reductase [Treponema sp.]MCL2250812.1 thioredoxin-disulfide reductase [Treponema sp.]
MAILDLIIIGAGPAGLTAAQYGARANLKVLVIEMLSVGGQAILIDVLENYPGNAGQNDMPPKSGYEFAVDLHRQAELFGASIIINKIKSVKKIDSFFEVLLDDGTMYLAPVIIIATGAKPRLLEIPGEAAFTGRGVSYCATCDGHFFKGKKIFVVGGGDAACDEARYLANLTTKVILIHRRDSFRAQKALAARTLENPNIEVRFNTVIKEIKGEQKVKTVVLQKTDNSDSYEEDADAVFIFAGTVPQTSVINNLEIEKNEDGYIIVNQKMETSIEGLYAAGDVRAGAFRQVVTAAADGAIAAHNAAKFIDQMNN